MSQCCVLSHWSWSVSWLWTSMNPSSASSMASSRVSSRSNVACSLEELDVSGKGEQKYNTKLLHEIHTRENHTSVTQVASRQLSLPKTMAHASFAGNSNVNYLCVHIHGAEQSAYLSTPSIPQAVGYPNYQGYHQKWTCPTAIQGNHLPDVCL